MSWKLVLGIVLLVATFFGPMVRDLGWDSAVGVLARVISIVALALFIGWLIATGLAETFRHAD